MPRLNVSIIDDGYPTMETHLSFEEIDQLVKIDDWGSESDLRKLNIKLISEALKWKQHIKLRSYRHPTFYFNEGRYDDDFLIFDWEYNPMSEPTEDLKTILNKSQSKIFVFSAWDKIDKIPELLNTPAFKSFKEADRYEILNKNEDQSATDILKKISDAFNKGEVIKWQDLELKLTPSKYLIDFEDFWKIQSLLGKSKIYDILKTESIINEEKIISLFSRSNYTFFIDESKTILCSSASELYKSRFGQLKELSMIDALKAIGIDKMEEAKEQGYIELKS